MIKLVYIFRSKIGIHLVELISCLDIGKQILDYNKIDTIKLFGWNKNYYNVLFISDYTIKYLIFGESEKENSNAV